MNDEIKSIKVVLPYVDEQGKDGQKEMTVKFQTVVQKEKPEYNNGHAAVYSMNMSLVLPDHIHKKLVGANVGRKSDINDRDNRQFPLDFSKTITANSLEGLTNYYRGLIYDYRWLLSRENLELSKVIFFDFSGRNGDNCTSNWDRKKVGSESEIEFGFMVGYISTDEGRNKPARFNEDKKIIDSKDGVQHTWGYVEHTPEREDFFKSIFTRFVDMLAQLEKFKKGLTPQMIDTMINNGAKLLS